MDDERRQGTDAAEITEVEREREDVYVSEVYQSEDCALCRCRALYHVSC